MFPQVQIERRFFRSWPHLYGFSQGSDRDAFGEIGRGIAPVVKEHRYLGGPDEIGIFPGVGRRREVDMPEVVGDREGHEALIGRAGIPGGQHAESLAGQKPPDDCPDVWTSSCFHCLIFDESPPFVNTGLFDRVTLKSGGVKSGGRHT